MDCGRVTMGVLEASLASLALLTQSVSIQWAACCGCVSIFRVWTEQNFVRCWKLLFSLPCFQLLPSFSPWYVSWDPLPSFDYRCSPANLWGLQGGFYFCVSEWRGRAQMHASFFKFLFTSMLYFLLICHMKCIKIAAITWILYNNCSFGFVELGKSN